ncbi:MAG: GH92 family glycosyl hydrolase [Clostridia bacterium]|nr:GH92 family glycosyl hydrolase [Clostridia bacterium]
MKKTDYIDPIIGTVGDEQETSMHGGGKTHPGATYPFGMVQLSPDTTTSGDNGTGYNYCQSTIEGFSFNHMSGIGWYGDLGNLQLMPVVGETDLRSGSNDEVEFKNGDIGWKSPFSHERETAKAGYYSVFLDRYRVLCEASVTCHTGILRFTYPKNQNSGIIFNFSRRIAGRVDYEKIKINGKRIEGHLKCTPAGGGFGRGNGGIGYDLYFSLELSCEYNEARFFENEQMLDKGLTQAEGEDLHLRVSFATEEQERVLVRCGISYVSLEGARENLDTECGDFDFERIREQADGAWERAFDSCSVEDGSEQDLTLFYTCLYHSFLDPRTSMDVNGSYLSANKEITKASYNHRTMFSGWDVYRSEFPLLTLLKPRVVKDEINTLINIAKAKNSSFPRWELMGVDSRCMVGDPGLIVIADALVKGICDFDYNGAYEIANASSRSLESLNGSTFTSLRPKCSHYVNNAYVPHSLSETLEYLMADYTMANFAKTMGRVDDFEHFMSRAMSYSDNYNPKTGFMGARDEKGEFVPVKDEYDTRGCVESNIFQQGWFVPYDIEGLSRLYGRERAIALLERLFEGADLTALWNENYNHSNEPCHNLTHYFNLLGLPKRTQYWTRRVQKEAYRLGAFGFCGNEDVGQLSAWYVLSAIGFAQICMTDKRYFINTPLFKKAKIKLDRRYHSCSVSNEFTVACDKDPDEYPYIEKAILNGRELDEWFISYDQITCGGYLELKLSKE